MAFIINETFTTGSRPASWHAGSIGDFGYATSPAPLEGSYSLQMDGSTTGQALFVAASEETGEQWGHFLLNFPTLPGTFQHVLNLIEDDLTTHLLDIIVNSTGTVTIDGAGHFETTASSISANTTYHVWWRHLPSTGSNDGEVELWINTSDDRAGTAGGFHATSSTGTTTGGPYLHSFQSATGGAGLVPYIVDKVQWADTDEFAGGGGGGNRRRRILLCGR